jgi:Tfp pilus assembly protein PilF
MLFCLSLAAFGGCAGRAGNSDFGSATPEQQLSAFTNLGAARLLQNDLAGALSELSKAERIDPNNTDVLTYLGLTYYRRKDYPKAIEYYQKALLIDPNRTEVHNNLGLVYMDQKNFAGAKGEFEICLADPTYSKPYLPHYNLGLLEEAQGRPEAAEEVYKRLLALSPQYPPPFYRLGIIYYNRAEWRRAVDFLLNAVQLNKDYTEAFFLLAEAYEHLDLKDEAAESYGQVVVLAPNTALAIEAQSRARRVLGYE